MDTEEESSHSSGGIVLRFLCSVFAERGVWYGGGNGLTGHWRKGMWKAALDEVRCGF